MLQHRIKHLKASAPEFHDGCWCKFDLTVMLGVIGVGKIMWLLLLGREFDYKVVVFCGDARGGWCWVLVRSNCDFCGG